jgi:hypothetical protein
LADVDFVEETVDPAILLVQGDGERDGMPGIVSDSLQVQDQFRGLFGGYRISARGSHEQQSEKSAHFKFLAVKRIDPK